MKKLEEDGWKHEFDGWNQALSSNDDADTNNSIFFAQMARQSQQAYSVSNVDTSPNGNINTNFVSNVKDNNQAVSFGSDNVLEKETEEATDEDQIANAIANLIGKQQTEQTIQMPAYVSHQLQAKSDEPYLETNYTYNNYNNENSSAIQLPPQAAQASQALAAINKQAPRISTPDALQMHSTHIQDTHQLQNRSRIAGYNDNNNNSHNNNNSNNNIFENRHGQRCKTRSRHECVAVVSRQDYESQSPKDRLRAIETFKQEFRKKQKCQEKQQNNRISNLDVNFYNVTRQQVKMVEAQRLRAIELSGIIYLLYVFCDSCTMCADL